MKTAIDFYKEALIRNTKVDVEYIEGYYKDEMKVAVEAMKEYAKAMLQKAADNAKLTSKYSGCSDWCGADGCSPDCANSKEYQVIDKQSILNTELE